MEGPRHAHTRASTQDESKRHTLKSQDWVSDWARGRPRGERRAGSVEKGEARRWMCGWEVGWRSSEWGGVLVIRLLLVDVCLHGLCNLLQQRVELPGLIDLGHLSERFQGRTWARVRIPTGNRGCRGCRGNRGCGGCRECRACRGCRGCLGGGG